MLDLKHNFGAKKNLQYLFARVTDVSVLEQVKQTKADGKWRLRKRLH